MAVHVLFIKIWRVVDEMGDEMGDRWKPVAALSGHKYVSCISPNTSDGRLISIYELELHRTLHIFFSNLSHKWIVGHVGLHHYVVQIHGCSSCLWCRPWWSIMHSNTCVWTHWYNTILWVVGMHVTIAVQPSVVPQLASDGSPFRPFSSMSSPTARYQ